MTQEYGFKGQSAIEYLMTYGWMLLVVAIVGGAVFALAGGQCVESTSGFTGGVMVSDFAINADSGDMVVAVANEDPDTIEVEEVVISSDSGEVVQEVDDFVVRPSESEPLPLAEGLDTSEECNTYDITIRYDDDALSNVDSSGQITGGLTMTAETPTAPDLSNVDQ